MRPMRTQKFRFNGFTGHELAAALDLPDGEVRATALLAHCFTCGKDTLGARHIGKELAAQGIAVLRFDFSGLGSSAGEFANSTFSSNVDDLVMAARRLEEMGYAPSILIGHSLGGAAILAAAERIAPAKAVVAISAPSDPGYITRLFADQLGEGRTNSDFEVSLAGRAFRIKRSFLDDISEQQLLPKVTALRKALLVLHSPTDDTVGIENATRLFVAARHPKSFVSLDGADHLLSKASDAAYVAEIVAAWSSRYLPPATEGNESPKVEERRVAVRETGVNAFQQLITTGSHVLVADEPVPAGGGDTGPGPYDLLLAALGACASPKAACNIAVRFSLRLTQPMWG